MCVFFFFLGGGGGIYSGFSSSGFCLGFLVFLVFLPECFADFSTQKGEFTDSLFMGKAAAGLIGRSCAEKAASG